MPFFQHLWLHHCLGRTSPPERVTCADLCAVVPSLLRDRPPDFFDYLSNVSRFFCFFSAPHECVLLARGSALCRCASVPRARQHHAYRQLVFFPIPSRARKQCLGGACLLSALVGSPHWPRFRLGLLPRFSRRIHSSLYARQFPHRRVHRVLGVFTLSRLCVRRTSAPPSPSSISLTVAVQIAGGWIYIPCVACLSHWCQCARRPACVSFNVRSRGQTADGVWRHCPRRVARRDHLSNHVPFSRA